jgi:hypothetical protein
MKRIFPLVAALAAAPVFAQTPTVSGDIQVWYTQMMDSNLRQNGGAPYYNLRSEFKENTFSIRRSELKISGNITDDILYEAMIDPSINTTSLDATKPNSSYNPTVLQDADILWKIGGGFELKVGQFKNLQTYEGNISSTELLFAERSQIGRVFGDKRDRGAVLSLGSGDPKEFAAKVSLGVFNGMNDLASGKANDNNAQKDMVARLDFTVSNTHKFGLYTLQGSTDQADKGALAAYAFAGAPPTAADILDNKDKTTNIGAYYVLQTGPWHLSAEYMTGLLGRRFGSVYGGGTPASANALRQHLDQKFVGYYLTGGYTIANHSFVLRYDTLNYNSGDQWYTGYNPYTMSNATTPLNADYTPKFTEITVGYTYAWKPEKVKAANFKLNYIARSKNFLKPNAVSGETGEQGGNTIVAAFQVAF